MAVKTLPTRVTLSWVLAVWPNQIISLDNLNVRYSNTHTGEGEGAKSSKKTVSRSHRAAGVLRSRSQDRWDGSRFMHPVSGSGCIWCHLALLALATPSCFQSSTCQAASYDSQKTLSSLLEAFSLLSLPSSFLIYLFYFFSWPLWLLIISTAWSQSTIHKFSP